MKRVLTILLLSIFFLSLTAAKITIDSTPQQIYNLGDTISVSVTTKPISDYGNLNIDLLCESGTINLLKWSAASFGEQTDYQLPLKKLTQQDLELESYDQILGQCQLSAKLGAEQDLTDIFTVTRDITITPSLDKANYNPGETITLTIDAIKANGDLLNGFVEISDLESISKAIVEGTTTEQFRTPETKEAGTYNLNLFVYDEGNSGILNQANSFIEVIINQVPSFIQTSLSAIEVNPGEFLDFTLDIYDQSGIAMPGAIQTTITSPIGEEKLFSTNSGESNSAEFSTNATPGTYIIKSEYENIEEEKEFTVLSIQKVSFDFLDTILIITNIGNDRYNKTIEVQIGEETQKLDLNIKPGEERRFNLKAPNGEYDVQITDGTDTTEKTLLLTGKAISINDLSNLSIFKDYWLIWVFVIIILALVVIVLFIRYRRKGRILSPKTTAAIKSNASNTLHFTNKSPEAHSLEEAPYKNDMMDVTAPKMSEAQSTLVLKGDKQKSSIVILKIKNQLTQNAKHELANILQIATQNKGMIDPKGDYIMMIFTALATKTFENEALAAKTASEIFKQLNEYNKRAVDKIKFSIGVNSGDLITSIKDKKLQYTSVGSTILLAKKIADRGENQILVSANIRTKLSRTLKTEKAGEIGNSPYYSVSRIVNISENQDKLKEILKRMQRE